MKIMNEIRQNYILLRFKTKIKIIIDSNDYSGANWKLMWDFFSSKEGYKTKRKETEFRYLLHLIFLAASNDPISAFPLSQKESLERNFSEPQQNVFIQKPIDPFWNEF